MIFGGKLPKDSVGVEQVLITNGSMQAIPLLAQANLEWRHNVIRATPCFSGITDAFPAASALRTKPFSALPLPLCT